MTSFAAGFFFFAIAAVIYGLLAEEPVGTVALAFTAGLAFLVGYYLLFPARRIDPRPEDSKTAEIVEGAGGQVDGFQAEPASDG